MKKMRNPTGLRLLFIVAVILPCLVLGVIAIRSINREEAFIAIRLQRKMQWDPEREQFINDDEANRMLSKAMRPPWRL